MWSFNRHRQYIKQKVWPTCWYGSDCHWQMKSLSCRRYWLDPVPFLHCTGKSIEKSAKSLLKKLPSAFHWSMTMIISSYSHASSLWKYFSWTCHFLEMWPKMAPVWSIWINQYFDKDVHLCYGDRQVTYLNSLPMIQYSNDTQEGTINATEHDSHQFKTTTSSFTTFIQEHECVASGNKLREIRLLKIANISSVWWILTSAVICRWLGQNCKQHLPTLHKQFRIVKLV